MVDNRTPAGVTRIVLALLLAGVAVAILGMASSPTTAPQTSTTLLASPATTLPDPTTLPAAESVLDGQTLESLVPGVSGELVVAITAGQELELITWPVGGLETSDSIPMLTGPVLEFDSTGHRLAFLGQPTGENGATLHAGTLDDWRPLANDVTSFAWHRSQPRRVAWLQAEAGICSADIAGDGSISGPGPTCIPRIVGRLVGFDDAGFIIDTGLGVVRLSEDGRPVKEVAGHDAFIGPDGRVLVVAANLEDLSQTFTLTDSNLDTIDILAWAPEGSMGEYGYVAWSPVSDPPELAFLVPADDGSYVAQHWSIDGSLLAEFVLPGRMWDIDWDSTGRYLLVPGVHASNTMVLHVIEVRTGAIFHIPFDNWVQDAQLVTTSDCRPAGQLAPEWAGRVPQGTTLRDFWHVRSRDPDLVGWRFLSARVVGGSQDGEIATWAIPGDVEGSSPGLAAIPANSGASNPDRAPVPLSGSDKGVDDWMQVDGARISQWCVETFG